MRVAIIGGGISGLASAFYLKHFDENIQISIFEKCQELGGKMKTRKINDFYIEEGTNGFLSNKPDTLDLVKLTNSEDLLLKSDDLARIRFIYKDKLHLLPESPKAFLETKLLSFKGKLRVLMEFIIPAKKNDEEESLQSFGYRRVGKEMSDVFLDAMVAGVYASSPSKISVNAAFPLVVNLEKQYGGLFKGMIQKRKKSAGPGGVLMSWKQGVSTFIDLLAKLSKAKIYLNTSIKSLEKGDCGYILNHDKSLVFDKVILSTPAFVSSLLVKDISKTLSQKLNLIEYSPISVVGLGYENLNHDLKGFGLLTTSSAKQPILGVLWDSSIFSDRASNKKLLRIMIGGQRDKELALKSEIELIKLAKEGVKNTMGVSDEPDVCFVKRYERGIPNYKIGHLNNVEEIFKELEGIEHLYLNSNAYKGVALNDCIKNSKICAKKVLGI